MTLLHAEAARAAGLGAAVARARPADGVDVEVGVEVGVGVEVLDGGRLTTVQDVPGRLGYWPVGVPPSGPMDDLSHRLVNRVVGNDEGAAGLELTGAGPALRFSGPALVALGGAAMELRLDGRAQPSWSPVAVPAGALVEVGTVEGPGCRAYLAVRGGFDTPAYLGSRSTFTLGGFGGHEGRALRADDRLTVGADVVAEPGRLATGLEPHLSHEWLIGVLIGPHAAPDFLTADGLDAFLRSEWEVHFNSARTGVRLVGPKPRWARPDGGDAGLHASNIHDTGYALGAVDVTGDMPVVLGPDGPSLGGFVCPAVVVAAERWKLGQMAPGDRVRLVPWSSADAADQDRRRREWLARATTPIEPLARPCWNRPGPGPTGGRRVARPSRPRAATGAVTGRPGPPGLPDQPRPPGRRGLPGGTVRPDLDLDTSGVLGWLAADDARGRPEVTLRRAGDRFLLVEFGAMVLDLELRLWAHALDGWVGAHLGPGLVDATAGVRSLLVHVDGDRLTVADAAEAVVSGLDELCDVAGAPFPSRIVHLPLSWDDPATREAIRRYEHGVRADAPWCPWNIEFIRRINGLASVADVHRIVFEASYLVLGLGDVYLGAPVATPLDPRHRLVTTKYNPARTWTPENAVGIGGAYLCIYGMEGPGGYQFVGRTVQVWNRDSRGPHFERPWLLRNFDQLRFHPVSAEELTELRALQAEGRLELRIEPASFRLDEHRRFLAHQRPAIERFRAHQQAAFAAERHAWAEAGELDP